MGDRVVIWVYESTEDGKYEESPICGVYAHWGGESAVETIKGALPTMRRGGT